MNYTVNTLFVSIATITILLSAAVKVQAQAEVSPETRTPEAAPRQTLYLHGFRSPSIGIEYRRGNIGLHSGLYLTNLSRNETTRFQKTGLTAYFPSLGVSRKGKSEAYLSVAYVRGLNRDYDNKNGVFIEQGLRWQFRNRLEARLGVGVLVVSGQSTKINPTPGVSWSVPL